MPYKSFKRDDEWCVFKLDAEGEPHGDTLGCHDSKSAADKQVAALYAAEDSEEKFTAAALKGLLKNNECAPTEFIAATGTERDGMEEAATLKTKVQRLMRDAEAVLKDKSIPAKLRKEVEDVRRELKRTWASLSDDANGEKEETEEMQEATKTVDGKKYPSGDFLVVEDPDKPSTWHLQVKRNGKADHRLMGAAWAALHKGYRGNRYEGPDKAKAITKLKALYKSEDMEIPGESAELGEAATSFSSLKAQRQTHNAIAEVHELTYDFQSLANNILYSVEIPNKVNALRALADEYVALVSEMLAGIGETEEITAPWPENGPDDGGDIEETALAENDVGSIVALHESQEVEDDRPRPLELDVVVIEPGWGNKKDNHYYSAEMLAKHASVFNGAKMYATNHKDDEKNVLTEVSQVLKCPVAFTETGAPIARVGVFDDAFAESIRNRAALGKLGDLNVSILANGTARPFELDGRKGKYVETIAEGANVDWVTRAGAGGRALRLAEADEIQQENEMEEETTNTAEEEQEAPAEVQTEPEKTTTAETEAPAQPVRLSESEVQETLDASKLPDVSRERLKVVEYADQGALDQAIAAEREYVAELTGAGRPVGQDAGDPPRKTGMTEEEYREALDEIDKRYGVYREIPQ